MEHLRDDQKQTLNDLNLMKASEEISEEVLNALISDVKEDKNPATYDWWHTKTKMDR